MDAGMSWLSNNGLTLVRPHAAGTLIVLGDTHCIVDAIGPHCIVAEGVGERDLRDYSSVTGADVGVAAPAGPVDARDVRWNDIRLHRIRRSFMLFDPEPTESRDVVDLATAPAALPVGEAAAAVYHGSRYVYSDHILQTTPATLDAEKARAKAKTC
jgi:hypothetical protein